MTNAEKFKQTFNGMLATELWAMPEKDFLKWLNHDPVDDEIDDLVKSVCRAGIGEDELTSYLQDYVEYLTWCGDTEDEIINELKDLGYAEVK